MIKNISKEEKAKMLEMNESDILKKLMGTYEAPTATFSLDRLGIPVTLKGLVEGEMSRVREECRDKDGKVDGNEYDAGLIVAATTNFNWNNKQLLDSIKASDGKQYIIKKLLAGEKQGLINKVLELSGYKGELEEIEEIKNSSVGEEQ